MNGAKDGLPQKPEPGPFLAIRTPMAK
jgi:hypothetical protein